MPSALLLWMIAIEQLIHRPINWDRVWHFEIIASTGDCAVEADKQKTSAAREDLDETVRLEVVSCLCVKWARVGSNRFSGYLCVFSASAVILGDQAIK